MLQTNVKEHILLGKEVNPELEKKLLAGNTFDTLKNPYLEESEWGWTIDSVGLRITMNELYGCYQHRMDYKKKSFDRHRETIIKNKVLI